MDFTDRESIERAAEFTYLEQGIPGLGEMPTIEAYKLGFVAGMRLAGEEILKLAREKTWQAAPLEALDRDLTPEQVAAIARALELLRQAGFDQAKLLTRQGELRLGLT